MKKYILIFITLFAIPLMNAQNYLPYYKNIKNIIQISECATIDKNDKNNTIRCLDRNLNIILNNYFNEINSINYDSVNPGRLNHIQLLCEVKYSQLGKIIDFKVADYTANDPELIEQYKEKITASLHVLPQIIEDNYKIVSPAIDYNNQPISSTIPLVLSVKIVNGATLFKYRYFPDTHNLSDYNDYNNDTELKSFYNMVYSKIEKTFSKNFKPIALNNNIKNCYAHLYFEITADGQIENVKNIQKGNTIFENYLKEQLLKNRDEIKKQVVVAKLLDGTATNKTYLMSFKYGF